MGNNLAATAPSQICSVDSYLEDEAEFVFVKSMGSTRFMKVACAHCKEGHVIVKVFANLNSNLDLTKYKMDLEEIKTQLKHASNCLPFQNIVITEKAALLIRQYVKYNLYDRISTRPFYTPVERKWIAFQLLCSLNQITKLGLCHGDIKCENIMISSWNWLLLTDFASYKPVMLPDNNPADFNYFFDTSRRRICYIAPERFSDSIKESSFDSGDKLLPPMDIFSAGCVIAELFTDGMPPFDLAQLLAYKEDKYYPNQCLNKIEDENIRSLVSHMIQKDPKNRLTAEQYLTKWKGTAFPNEFYTFLKRYLGYFGEPPLLSADQTVNYLYSDVEKFIKTLALKFESKENNLLVIVLSLVLPCMRQLCFCSCKLKALNIIKRFCEHLSSEFILERIVPYLLDYVTDKIARVRAYALEILTFVMSQVTYIPEDESGIFTEYIFPGITCCGKDKSVLVRQTLAKHIADLSQMACNFVDSSKASQSLSYDVNMYTLHEVIQEQLQVLLSDQDSTVRQCLLKHSVPKLCTLFGHQKSNDIILSHMITFLNDKFDWQLRAAFFDSILEVALCIGWQSSVILKPLLQQGLSDDNEQVVSKTLCILKTLVNVGYFSKEMVSRDLKDVFPLCLHPCQWVRQTAISVVAACVDKFNFVDVQCYLLPLIQPFFKDPNDTLYKSHNIILSLQSPLRYDVLNVVLNCSSIPDLIRYIQEKKSVEKSGHELNMTTVNCEEILPTCKKLTSLAIRPEEETKILLLNSILRSNRSLIQNDGYSTATVNLSSLDITRRHAELFRPADDNLSQRFQNLKVGNGRTASDSSDKDSKNKRSGTQDSASGKKSTRQRRNNLKDAPISMSQLEASVSPHIVTAEPSDFQLKYTNCKLNLRTLVHHKRNLFDNDISTLFFEESVDAAEPLSAWHPSGILLAHISEHKGSINQIAVSPSHRYFSTVSSDCTMKLWDCNKLDGKSIINMSKATYSKKSKLFCTVFYGNDKVACASESGHIDVIDINQTFDNSSDSEKSTTERYSLNTSINAGQGRIMSMAAMQKTPLIVYITSKGTINAWDMRMPNNAWSLQHDLSNGLLTALALDKKEQWLCVGTLNGSCICWDVRFSLPVCKLVHPSSAGIKKMVAHPKLHSAIIASVMGNNEVSIWNLENSFRDVTLWASTAPTLSLTEKSADTVNGLEVNIHSGDSIQIITGGTDSKIRFWDLKNVNASRVISGPGDSVASYITRRIEGTYVVQEVSEKVKHSNKPSTSKAEELYFSATGKVAEHHQNIITDLAQINLNQSMLVSTSRDGVIKVWK